MFAERLASMPGAIVWHVAIQKKQASCRRCIGRDPVARDRRPRTCAYCLGPSVGRVVNPGRGLCFVCVHDAPACSAGKPQGSQDRGNPRWSPECTRTNPDETSSGGKQCRPAKRRSCFAIRARCKHRLLCGCVVSEESQPRASYPRRGGVPGITVHKPPRCLPWLRANCHRENPV